MTYSQFLKIILTYKKISEDFNELYNMGFDFNDGKFRLEFLAGIMFDNTIDISFNSLGSEIIYWYMLENDFGQKDWSKSDTYFLIKNGSMEQLYHDKDTEIKYGLYDEDKNMVATSTEELYNYVIKYCKNGS